MPTLPVSVVIPTLGRPSLRACLDSLAACEPAPGEILVVDQSEDFEAPALVEASLAERCRVVRCEGPGVARATNVGLRAAAHPIVLVTHDDCTVAPDWVAACWRHMSVEPAGIVTGSVHPAGDGIVPSCKTDPTPRDFTGEVHYGVLYPNNMAVPRQEVLTAGAFDERSSLLVAEDLDFCYRWLRSGRPMRYRPDMVVSHHDWRTPEQLVQTYLGYGHGQGAFFAKHLHARDWNMVPYLVRTVGVGLRGVVAGVVRRRPRWADERRGILPGLPVGFVAGWREARRIGRSGV